MNKENKIWYKKKGNLTEKLNRLISELRKEVEGSS